MTDTVTITTEQHDNINRIESQISALLNIGGAAFTARDDESEVYITVVEDKFKELMAVVREVVDQGIEDNFPSQPAKAA